METVNGNDEIDLLQLLKKIVIFFSKHAKVLLIATIVAGSLGFLKVFLDKGIYKSNLIGVSNILNTEDVVSIVEKCRLLIEDGNAEELARMLQIDSLEAKKIVGIKVTSEIIPSKTKLEAAIRNKFNFELEVTDYNLYYKLNSSIPNLIRNNKYTKLKTDLIIYTKEKIYEKLVKEIRLLDSMKINITPGIVSGKSTFFLSNPSMINESIMKLYSEQMDIYEVLNTRQDLLVIEDFVILKNPYNKKSSVFIKSMLIFGGAGFILTMLVGLFKEMLSLTKK